MNAEQMRAVLLAIADLIGRGEGAGRATGLRRLAAVFEGVGTAKTATIVRTIEDNWRYDNRIPGHPPGLRETLVDIQKALASSGAKVQAAAFVDLLRLFGSGRNQAIDDFVVEAIAARTKRSRPRRGSAPRRTPLTAEQARSLASQLISAADDRNRFDTLLDQLKRECKLAELKAIAEHYTGYETTKTKKDDIIKSIRHWHREDELNRDRGASQAKAGL